MQDIPLRLWDSNANKSKATCHSGFTSPFWPQHRLLQLVIWQPLLPLEHHVPLKKRPSTRQISQGVPEAPPCPTSPSAGSSDQTEVGKLFHSPGRSRREHKLRVLNGAQRLIYA